MVPFEHVGGMFRTTADTCLNVGSRNGNIPIRCDLMGETLSVDSLSRFIDEARSAGTNNHRCSVQKEAQRIWGRPEDSISPPTQMWLKLEPVTSLRLIPPYVCASETCNIPSRCPVNNSCDARLIFTVLGGSRRVLSSKGSQTPRPRGWHLRPRTDAAVATKTAASK